MTRFERVAVVGWGASMVAAIAGILMPSSYERLSFGLFAAAVVMALLVAIALVVDHLRVRLRRRTVRVEGRGTPDLGQVSGSRRFRLRGGHDRVAPARAPAVRRPAPAPAPAVRTPAPAPRPVAKGAAGPGSLVFAPTAEPMAGPPPEAALLGRVTDRHVPAEIVVAMDHRTNAHGAAVLPVELPHLWPFTADDGDLSDELEESA